TDKTISNTHAKSATPMMLSALTLIITRDALILLRTTRGIELMPLRALAFVPCRPAVFAECFGRGGIGAACEFQGLGFPVFLAQRSQHSLGCEGRFAQADSHRVVNGVSDRRYGRGQRALASLLGAERAFGIYAFHDDALDIG